MSKTRPTYKKLARSKLKPGMVVRTPAWYRDESGKKRLIAELWPNAPAELVVETWNWADGESRLRAKVGNDHLDLNVLDYPTQFEVRT